MMTPSFLPLYGICFTICDWVTDDQLAWGFAMPLCLFQQHLATIPRSLAEAGNSNRISSNLYVKQYWNHSNHSKSKSIKVHCRYGSRCFRCWSHWRCNWWHRTVPWKKRGDAWKSMAYPGQWRHLFCHCMASVLRFVTEWLTINLLGVSLCLCVCFNNILQPYPEVLQKWETATESLQTYMSNSIGTIQTIWSQNQSRSTADTAAAASAAGVTGDATGGITPFLGRSGAVTLGMTIKLLRSSVCLGICFNIFHNCSIPRSFAEAIAPVPFPAESFSSRGGFG